MVTLPSPGASGERKRQGGPLHEAQQAQGSENVLISFKIGWKIKNF